MKKIRALVVVAGLLTSIIVWADNLAPVNPFKPDFPSNPPLVLGPDERLITILGTNDIHGGLEVGKARGDGSPIGGMAFWGGVASSIRQGVAKRYGADRSGVLVVDAGDQFQGTLISNFNEGMLMFAAMNEVGYDAVITGNHDYDFGPIGWLDDQVTSDTDDKNPRGALLRAVGSAKFPMISANTFVAASIVNSAGEQLNPKDQFCQVNGTIDWSQAERPSYLKPYVIKEVAGLKVALIGLDNPHTPTTTTEANVTDLCFDDEAAAYTRVRKELEGKADVYVIVIHDGNTDTSNDVSKLVSKLPAGSVDAVVSGHTHWVTNTRVGGIAIIQSGSNGEKFGRIDLVYDTKTRKVQPAKTRSFGGIELVHGRCAPSAKSFCDASADGAVSYEGVPVIESAKIAQLVAAARVQVAQVAGRVLGTSDALVRVDRTRESPLANALTDALRGVTAAEVSFMNTGGIRAPIDAGDITYEDLFRVIPFNNHGLVIGPMGAEQVVGLLKRSILTCGGFGALMQSGLKVTFVRDCSHPVNELDPNAKLLHVETLSGEVIYDSASGGMVAPAGRTLVAATLDFLAAGGSGFDGFKGTPVIRDIGIVREAFVKYYLSNPAHLTAQTDGRWVEQKPAVE
jgi:2',3'-cyclic-nucleotide 2'-phosphodiesterase (5'-nucleotidase family)